MAVVRVRRCRESACACPPVGDGGAALALRAAVGADICPGGTVLVPTGLAIDAPPGIDMHMHMRLPDGLAARAALRARCAPGAFGGGSNDEFGVILTNAIAPQPMLQPCGAQPCCPQVPGAARDGRAGCAGRATRASQAALRGLAEPFCADCIRAWGSADAGFPVRALGCDAPADAPAAAPAAAPADEPCVYRVQAGDLVALLCLDPASGAVFEMES